jgi:hypothetical protein
MSNDGSLYQGRVGHDFYQARALVLDRTFERGLEFLAVRDPVSDAHAQHRRIRKHPNGGIGLRQPWQLPLDYCHGFDT